MSTLDNLRKEAKRWLKALRMQEASARARLRAAWPNPPSAPTLRDVQHALAREHGHESWKALIAAADATSSRGEEPPTLQKLRGLVQDLVLAFETGDAGAMRRLIDHFGWQVTWEELREGVRRQLSMIPADQQPEGAFGPSHSRLVIARAVGFESWTHLEALLLPARASARPLDAIPRGLETFDPGPGMIQPVELKTGFRVRFPGGGSSTTTQVWQMLIACRNGDLPRVQQLVETTPQLIKCDHNYMPPLHLAVRENHPEVVRYLLDRGAANPTHETYPYRESLITLATDRGLDDIARMLEEARRQAAPEQSYDQESEIEDERDEDRVRFQRLVNHDALPEAAEMLRARPDLALDELASWGEGILSMPANRGNRRMLEVLLNYGARVPRVSKWGAWYYFKRHEIAAFLIERGMSARHMNHHHTTVLHDMAYTGDVHKAALLLDNGAELDALDEEFRSTPLGIAVRFGKREMVELLLERGADPNKAGAPWATPLEWARKTGHRDLVSRLRHAGARVATARAPVKRQDPPTTIDAQIGAAIASKDVERLRTVLAAHPDAVAECRPNLAHLSPELIITRAHPARRLPVRPDLGALEREVEAAGGDDGARLAVARSYGAETWERLELAARLVDAIWRNDSATVRRIVTEHPTLLHEDARIRPNCNWGPPMTYAANLGRTRLIKLLHELGARDLYSAMDRAVLQGEIDTARMLYEMGARPSEETLEGPAETLNAEGMAFLLEMGVPFTPENAPAAMVLRTYGRNPRGKHQILELFAKHGIRLPDTPPMAVHRGRIDLLEAHLRRDPHLFSRTFAHEEIFPPELGCEGDEALALVGTPLGGAGLLHMCVEYDEMAMAAWIVEHGGDVNLRARVDREGFGGHTPLFNTVVSLGGGRGRHAEFVRLLLHQGADPGIRASLRKRLLFSDDESEHQYRDVTALEWGDRFHDRSVVNEIALAFLRARSSSQWSRPT